MARPAARAASAVDGPTTAICVVATASRREIFNCSERSWRARTAFWLVKKTQSYSPMRPRESSRDRKSSGGASVTIGSRIGCAPRSRNASSRGWLCSAARVITTRLPERALAESSATRALHLFKNAASAAFDEQLGHVLSELRSLIRRSRGTLANILDAIHGADHGVHHQLAAFDARPRAEGHLTAALQSGKQRTLGDDRGARFGIIKFAENVRGFRVFHAGFDGDGALPHGRQGNFGRKGFGDFLAPAEAVESRFGKNDGVVLAAFDFAQARVHVAPEFANIQIGAVMAQLRLAAQAAGADARALLEVGERSAFMGDEAITHVIAAADRGKMEPTGRFRGNILNAVDGKIHGFLEQCFFKLLDEDSFAADLRKRRLLHFIAGSLDDDDLRFDAGDLKELFADEFRLPARQDTASTADAEGPHGFSRSDR